MIKFIFRTIFRIMASEEVNRNTMIVSPEETGQSVSSTSQSAGNSKDANSTKSHEQGSRQSNLLRIQQRKQQIFNWPQIKKLLKLSTYSACQAAECKCTGWKNAQPIVKSQRGDVQQQPVINILNPCKTCTHTLENHITHLKSQTEEKLNKLLSMAIDADNLFMGTHREEDDDTKKIYFYLYTLLRKSILSMTKPTIEGPLGHPPFDKPSIAKAVMNFVLYKFSHLSPREWQAMCEMAKMFLHCLNHWNFEAPSAKKIISAEEASTYKINYTRWLVFCHVPALCDSFQHHDTPVAFGKSLMKAVFKSVCSQLIDKCHSERDKITPEKRVLVLTHFPKYVVNSPS